MQLHGPTADGGQHRSAAAGDVHGCIHIRELLPSLLEPRPVRFCDSSNILRRRGGRIRPMSRGQTRRALQCALVAIALSSQASFGQGPSPAAEDPFQRVRFLIGRWQGTTEGQPGKGTVARQYSTALNARFIRVTNRSTYPAQPANVKARCTKTRDHQLRSLAQEARPPAVSRRGLRQSVRGRRWHHP